MTVHRFKYLSALLVILCGLVLFGCGGGSSSSSSTPNPPPVIISVSLSPLSAQVLTGQSQMFTATASGTTNQNFTWSIDGAGSGNSTVGTISSDGTYTAPAVVPLAPTIDIRATSIADSTRFASASVTITSPVEDWPKYRRDLANTGRSIETGISSVNADPHRPATESQRLAGRCHC